MQGRAPEAIACYEHVALLQPESAEAHANLASCYKDAARQDTAIASYRRALQLRPDFPEAFANLVHSLQCVCEWRDRPRALPAHGGRGPCFRKCLTSAQHVIWSAYLFWDHRVWHSCCLGVQYLPICAAYGVTGSNSDLLSMHS